MHYELQCWGKENLNEYLQYLGEGKFKPEVNLPWVIISKYPDGDTIEFSSKSRSKAMEYMLQFLIHERYDKWEDEIIETFGLSEEVLNECILDYILSPDEKKLLGYSTENMKGDKNANKGCTHR